MDPDTANVDHRIELEKEAIAKRERRRHYLLTIRSQRAVRAQFEPRAGYKMCEECSGGGWLDNGQECWNCDGLGQVRRYVYQPPQEEPELPTKGPRVKCEFCGWPFHKNVMSTRDGKPICFACAIARQAEDRKEKKDASD